MFKTLFGKYRFLVISIALFLIFDLSVLVLNFYTSSKIAEQTERINLAGRQRTLTQQMSKATLYIKAQKLKQWVYQSGLEELRDHYEVFGETMQAFNQGGLVTSAETGEMIAIAPVDTVVGKAILAEANDLWSRFDTAIAPLMIDTLITDEEILPASAFIAANNLQMFSLMNQLTEHFTRESNAQTALLRRVQVAGITLATINFFIILSHFLKQLRGRDRRLEIKQHESDQILSTIEEGVFLVDKNLVIGGQHSRYLEQVFGTRNVAGRRLDRFLGAYFSESVVETALEFVNLYFQEHINSDLIADLNPLKQVKATVPTKSAGVAEKYLDFSFAPLKQENQDKVILVTVNDVTDTIRLAQQAEKNESRVEQQLALFSQILPIPPHDLKAFTSEALTSLEWINERLKRARAVTDNYTGTLENVAREAHKLKGSASVLSFEWISIQLYEFEETIQKLLELGKSRSLRGQDLLPLTIRLKQMYESIESINALRKRLENYGLSHPIVRAANSPANAGSTALKANKRWYQLHEFVANLAKEESLQVELRLRGFNKPVPETLSDTLYPLAIQLVRNSLAHGIESPTERQRLGKPECGQIGISLSCDDKNNYRFVFEDDGCGFDYQAIRQALVRQGVMQSEQAAKLKKAQLLQHAFKNHVSTRTQTSQVAGRGMGLPIVRQQVSALKGRIKIRSAENEFTQFIISFSLVQSNDPTVLDQSVA